MQLYRLAATCLTAALIAACGSSLPPIVGEQDAGATPDGDVTPAEIQRCPASVETGQPCSVGAYPCSRGQCVVCSDRYWRLARSSVLPDCICEKTGVWKCISLSSGGSGIEECIFDPPLDCAVAEFLYEDAACQTHPPCGPGS